MIRTRRTSGNRLLAISPPSDIVLDVARAVDPAAVETARVNLLRRTGTASGAFSLTEAAAPGEAASPGVRAARQPDSLQRFEAMVLQTFFQNMMPKQTAAVYGEGMAGDMWKSMMAERLAGVVAERGGIGIADRMLRDHYVVDEKTVPIGPVSNLDARQDTDHQLMLSTAMVQEMQRKLTRAIADGQSAADAAKI